MWPHFVKYTRPTVVEAEVGLWNSSWNPWGTEGYRWLQTCVYMWSKIYSTQYYLTRWLSFFFFLSIISLGKIPRNGISEYKGFHLWFNTFAELILQKSYSIYLFVKLHRKIPISLHLHQYLVFFANLCGLFPPMFY